MDPNHAGFRTSSKASEPSHSHPGHHRSIHSLVPLVPHVSHSTTTALHDGVFAGDYTPDYEASSARRQSETSSTQLRKQLPPTRQPSLPHVAHAPFSSEPTASSSPLIPGHHHLTGATSFSSSPPPPPLPPAFINNNDSPPPSSATTSSKSRFPVKLLENPPDLAQWRQKLFELSSPLVLTQEQFETYFPWIDNVYSHRSTQSYKRKPLVTHYWDCRLKGRPSGVSKSSENPNKRKRKRTKREMNLCEVKIKITEHLSGAVNTVLGNEDGNGNGNENGNENENEYESENETKVVGKAKKVWSLQMVNAQERHQHSLEESDEIKKSTAQKWLAEREKERVKMNGDNKERKVAGLKATGAAAATARKRSLKRSSGGGSMQFYAACFCPYSQRVWIALEAKGIDYQYCETYPFQNPKPKQLLEANPRGMVPALREGDWACAESTIILEYLEDIAGHNGNCAILHPSSPKLRANCRLMIDFINTKIVPCFYELLSATEGDAQRRGRERLQREIDVLVKEADDDGPFFLGKEMCLVDVHLAPFALRLPRILQSFRGWEPPIPGSRWKRWLDAIEKNEHVKNTTSSQTLYVKTTDDLIKSFNR